MTKEEQWKREAERNLDELDDRGFDFDNWSISDAYERGYCDCAESKEKRITELEATNKKISDECHKLVDSLEKKQKEIAGLEKENANLRVSVESTRCAGIELLSDKRKQLTKAKEIIKKFSEFVNNEIEYDPERPQEHTDSWNELCKQAEQFIKDNEV